ncbi:tripartite ATP-independent periplasmic transporter solute receptor, DctP family [Acetomicrobium mobile DSM 13181]|uniref:Tripartite ATP-independent periplasmic transporter solute receptor, DctP family n=1 Tax=Acetomicrobium mobile (strain ATCC BAA-54 / DSM 13181 / JCM 12221 / NGA) TaxID=891968 RepID=I4BX89_ACEMN|nr:TRAP transporter substrate-binding protein [Acetomicrobium mobile]AFM21896.1 tripartite ATP-independent periplasmic transporter solute receptor, DctP family [Acetomicrobium mobile DSM 13181]
MKLKGNKKRLALVIIVLLGLFMSIGHSSKTEAAAETKPEYTLQLAGAYPSTGNTPRAFVTQKIKEMIEQRSNGKIKVEVYLDNQLGGDREILEGCQVGGIAMVSQTTAPQVTFIPELAVFDIPMLFDNLDLARKVLSGPFRQKLEPLYEKAGLKLLLFEPIYYRETTTNKPIKTINDFKGIKIRTMENKYHMAFWKALGANPTPLNFSELYIALQQGIVDAQENPYEIVWANKFYEVQKYLVNTHHICFILSIVMNKGLYDSMPAEYKKIITDSMNEAGNMLFENAKANNQALLANVVKQGMTVIELTDDMKQGMDKAAKGVEQMVRKDVGNGIVDDLMTAIKNAKK